MIKRISAAIPQNVDDDLAAMVEQCGLSKSMVMQCGVIMLRDKMSEMTKSQFTHFVEGLKNKREVKPVGRPRGKNAKKKKNKR